MKEILFRGKRLDTGKWIEGDYFREMDVYGKIHHQIFELLGFGFWHKHEVDPETVGMYTGILDKEGQKIYEGDIVLNRPETLKAVIKYGSFTPSITVTAYGHPIALHGLYAVTEKGGDIVLSPEPILKVIGNVYDNPELMEGRE